MTVVDTWTATEVDALVKKLFPNSAHVVVSDRKRHNTILEVSGNISARYRISSTPSEDVDVEVQNPNTYEKSVFPWKSEVNPGPEGDVWEIENGGLKFVVTKL